MPWITSDDVTAALGGPVDDPDFLDQCTAAANDYAVRRRREAGYVDDPDVSPGDAAAMGATMYAVALYREKGSADSYASFDAFAGSVPMPSTFGQVNRLLGVPRGAVDRPPDYDEIAIMRARRYLSRLPWPY